MQLSKEEIQVVLNLIDRVQLSGKEVKTVAYIQNKLESGLQEPQQGEEPKEKKK